MKFSIITPTNNSQYLHELEASILNQKHTDWEWIIVLNNNASFISKSQDPRIKILTLPFDSTKVGEIKQYSFFQGTGEILVEVDHDDLLFDNCLQELEIAFQDPTVGFVYSNDAVLGEFKPFSNYFGWTYSTILYKGMELYTMNSFNPYPGRVGLIWFTPDHVRAWRKSIYIDIGGHDKSLSICDDQELIIRTYLKTKFFHIPKPLYIYRIHGGNTWIQRSAEIQNKTTELFEKYILQLSIKYADLENGFKIDLCGGSSTPKGFINIDLDPKHGDIHFDLNTGIPFKDNSVAVVRAFDALEHIKDSVFLMKEIHRVLKPGGVLISLTPSTDGRGAFQDPTHCSFWNENSFWYYTRSDQSRFINLDPLFYELLVKTYFPSDWHKQNNISYVFAVLEVKKQ